MFSLSLGTLIMLESYFYIKLPLDLVPDFIPIIGKCDDMIAYVVGLVGFWVFITAIIVMF